MLLLKDDGDNDVGSDSDVVTASATSPFVSAPVVGDDDDDDDDDELYGPSLLEILREGNLVCLTIWWFPYLINTFKLLSILWLIYFNQT